MRVVECTVLEVFVVGNSINGNTQYKIKTNRGVFMSRLDSDTFSVNWHSLSGKEVRFNLNNRVFTNLEVIE